MATLIRQYIILCITYCSLWTDKTITIVIPPLEASGYEKKRWNTRKYILKTNMMSTIHLIKPLTLLPHSQKQWTKQPPAVQNELQPDTEKPAEHLTVQAWLVKSIMFWMWMMAGMIALEYKLGRAEGQVQNLEIWHVEGYRLDSLKDNSLRSVKQVTANPFQDTRIDL